jgi:hypothetical protein
VLYQRIAHRSSPEVDRSADDLTRLAVSDDESVFRASQERFPVLWRRDCSDYSGARFCKPRIKRFVCQGSEITP